MIVPPTATPVTMPVVLPMVAVAVLLLLHVPPDVASVKVIVNPWHTDTGPTIGAGELDTVTVVVTLQPEPKE
jgi:hypothetical protein